MSTLRDELRTVSDELMSRATELLTDLAAVQRVRGMPYAEQLRISASAMPGGMEGEVVKPSGEHASGELIGVTIHTEGSTTAKAAAAKVAKRKLKLSKGKVRAPKIRTQVHSKRARSTAAQAKARREAIINFAREHGNTFVLSEFKKEMVAELPHKYLTVGIYAVIRRMVRSKYLKRGSTKGVYRLYAKYAKR